MKKIYGFLSLVLLVAAWSCEEKENMDPVGNWDLTTPTISLPANNAQIVLDENNPDAVTRFEWQPASTTNRFIVQYEVALVEPGTADYANSILTLTPGNNAKEVFVTPTAEEIDYALSTACYPAGSTVDLQVAVIAKSIDKQTVTTQTIKVTRFAHERVPSTLFLTGEATEGGTDLSKAVALRAIKNQDGDQTGVFDVYTHLTAGTTYFFRDQAIEKSRKFGGSAGQLSCGTTIAAPETGEYRVRVNAVDNTYELLKIEKWSLVGDAVEGGWGGDVPLTYIGGGVWEKEIMFYLPYEGAGWILRANGDWGYLLKRVQGTATANNKGGELVMESEAADQGLEFEDMPGTTGLHKVTVDLSSGAYTYNLTKVASPIETIIGKATDIQANAVSGTFPIQGDMPTELFLLEDDNMILQFTKDGDVFKSEKFVALQANKTYTLNSAADGSGTAYDGDDDGVISVDHDQAYQINVDFDAGELSWKHWNLKLFHWDEVGGGWDQRQELLTTYVHPYKFEVTGNLFAGYHSKFISPWDVQFGTAVTTLTGTMTNGGANYTGINQNGTYKATIIVSDDFATGEYSFVKQ
jgi:starch-binding outer membrane protein SusE/F